MLGKFFSKHLWRQEGLLRSAHHFFHKIFSRRDVTLCRWPAKQTIPLSVLARNQTKGFGLEISPWPKVEGDARRELVGKKELTGSWRRDTDKGSRQWTPEQRGESARERVQTSEEDRVKMSRHSSCFVEFALESMLALVYICYRKCSVA